VKKLTGLQTKWLQKIKDRDSFILGQTESDTVDKVLKNDEYDQIDAYWLNRIGKKIKSYRRNPNDWNLDRMIEWETETFENVRNNKMDDVFSMMGVPAIFMGVDMASANSTAMFYKYFTQDGAMMIKCKYKPFIVNW